MFKNRKIGVFISHIYGPYQRELCQGIIDKAASHGYLVEIFSSNDGENFGYNTTKESSILRIPNFDNYSGIVFASNTYVEEELKNDITKVLKEQKTCPVIETNNLNPQFHSIDIDNNSSTIQMVEHLINTHKYKRICYMGNSNDNYYSNKRFDYYKQAMKKNNLEVTDRDYYMCDGSESDIEKAIDYLFDNEKSPEAIICYNDNLALKLMTILMKRGYNIPKDVAITGYDATEYGQKFNPPLTSMSFPVRELGFTVVDSLIELINDNELPSSSLIEASPLIKGSCGCTNLTEENPIIFSHELLGLNESMERDLIKSINMASVLQDIKDIDDGIDLIEKYVDLIYNCNEFYLCLYSDWDLIPTYIREITLTDDMEDEAREDTNIIMLKLAIKDGKRLYECSFTNKTPLPEFVYENSNSAYIYSPLFFNDLEFGYIVTSYKDNQLSYSFNFNSWLMNVNRMLKHIYDTKQIKLLVDRLESLHSKDELTGHYNIYKFNQLAFKALEESKTNGQSLIMFVVDLDNKRNIVENNGLSELNFAIQVVGHALRNSLDDTYICGHSSRGRFWVLSELENNRGVSEFLKSVNNYLQNYNRLQTKNYSINVSFGYTIKSPESTASLEELFETGLKNMFLEKDKKKL